MEPISTCFLVAGIALGAQGVSNRRIEPSVPSSTHSLVVDLSSTNTFVNLNLYERPVTTHIINVANEIYSNPKDKLFDDLLSYIVPDDLGISEDDADITHVITAYEFLEKLPSYFELPTLMKSDSGQIGMYWDTENEYLDINIEDFDVLSLYSRVRNTQVEQFIDGFSISDVTSEWFDANLAILDKSYKIAA